MIFALIKYGFDVYKLISLLGSGDAFLLETPEKAVPIPDNTEGMSILNTLLKTITLRSPKVQYRPERNTLPNIYTVG